MPKPSEILVWINDDGSARELTEADKKYVDSDFSPFDGARPYVKPTYRSRNGWGEIKGYLERDRLPNNVPINPAPATDPPPQRPQAVAGQILELIRKRGAPGR
jgi:hypothetical protein